MMADTLEITVIRLQSSTSDQHKGKPMGNGGAGAGFALGETCVANIGPGERKKRLAFGMQALGAGVVLTLVLIGLHADPLWRLLLFVPFSAAAIGYFQARDKT